MTLCTDLTEIGQAIAALPTTNAAAKHDALMFARSLATRGVPRVTVSEDDGVVLTYEGEAATVWYNAVNNVTGERTVRVSTRHDNGHSGVLDMSPRAVGLIAAMLLART